MKDYAKCLKLRKVCFIILILTDILLLFGSLYYYSSSIQFYYQDDRGAVYSVYSIECPPQITVVDKNGETALVPNNDKINFAVDITGQYVPVYKHFKYTGVKYFLPFLIIFTLVYHAISIWFLWSLTNTLKELETACDKEYEKII